MYVTNGVMERINELDKPEGFGCNKKNISKLEDDLDLKNVIWSLEEK